MNMSSTSHPDLIMKSGEYLAEILQRPEHSNILAKLKTLKFGGSPEVITSVAATLQHGDAAADPDIATLLHWNSHYGWWYVVYTAWYKLFGDPTWDRPIDPRED